MFTSDYDPYQELENAKLELLRQQTTIRQLCIAHNQNQELIADLVQQHSQAINLIKSTRHQVVLLRQEINDLMGLDKL